jgi:hypothetical protein
MVFYDETEFHYQLNKLVSATKIPVILTLSNKDLVKETLIDYLKDNGTQYDIIRYRYLRMRHAELYLAYKLIGIFEGYINSRTSSAEIDE